MRPGPAGPDPAIEPPPFDAAARLAADREAIHEWLLGMEADLERLVAASENANADDEHDPEGATVAFERSQLGALTERARSHLAEIDAATERLRTGTYGVCEVCLAPIGVERLDARPTARTCVEHSDPRRR